ncbi:hypothetical protein ACFQX7_03150 [Luedemannella flava]
MFFDGDSSSGVSGDLDSATQVASYMEGYWGMGATVSSYSTAKRLEVGGIGAPRKEREDETKVRSALADRIEDKLGEMLERVTEILKANRREVLALAHALETHKTLTGDDVVAVIERRPGPLVDGSFYADPELAERLEAYHVAAVAAHRGHAQLTIAMPQLPAPSEPEPAPALALAAGPLAAAEGGWQAAASTPAGESVAVADPPGEPGTPDAPPIPQQASPWMRPNPNGAEPVSGPPPAAQFSIPPASAPRTLPPMGGASLPDPPAADAPPDDGTRGRFAAALRRIRNRFNRAD